MGRASAEFKDFMGQRCNISTLDATSLAEMKTFATGIAKYSDGVISEVQYSQNEMQAAKTAAATSNVDRKGIVLVKDQRGAIHKVTIPSLKTGQTTKTDSGERLNTPIVEDVAKLVQTLIGKPCVGLYGYPIQKR